jgi:hypothetical protein
MLDVQVDGQFYIGLYLIQPVAKWRGLRGGIRTPLSHCSFALDMNGLTLYTPEAKVALY